MVSLAFSYRHAALLVNMLSTRIYIIYVYMGIVQKVLDLSVVFDDLWYAKMTFGES